MCCEDLKVGRAKRNLVTTQTTTGSVAAFVAHDPQRTCVSFFARDGEKYYVVPQSGGDTTIRIVVDSANPPVTFDVERYGPIVVGEWHVLQVSAGAEAQAIETRYDYGACPPEERR